MDYKNSLFYQNWIYPNLWIIVICIGSIAFFFSIWLSIWLASFQWANVDPVHTASGHWDKQTEIKITSDIYPVKYC